MGETFRFKNGIEVKIYGMDSCAYGSVVIEEIHKHKKLKRRCELYTTDVGQRIEVYRVLSDYEKSQSPNVLSDSDIFNADATYKRIISQE